MFKIMIKYTDKVNICITIIVPNRFSMDKNFLFIYVRTFILENLYNKFDIMYINLYTKLLLLYLFIVNVK